MGDWNATIHGLIDRLDEVDIPTSPFMLDGGLVSYPSEFMAELMRDISKGNGGPPGRTRGIEHTLRALVDGKIEVVKVEEETKKDKKDRKLVEIVSIYPLKGQDGPTKAYFKVRVGPILISGCRLIEDTSGTLFIDMPQQKGQHGRFWPVVKLESDKLKIAIEQAAIEAWGEKKK
mgnify:CR=1 FL=1